ncbi:MAG: class I SAM-dependent methyltransferase [Thermoplasmata archaeon]|nr:class I SAM-dependent methyltransferase [Thermoplasmata archaeon]
MKSKKVNTNTEQNTEEINYKDFMNWNENISETMRKNYNQLGWEADRGLFRDVICTLLEEGNNKILDVGCGPGIYFRGISNTHPNIDYTGLDYSSHMIEGCKKTYPKNDYPHAHFITGDIHDLEFADDSFDFVISSEVLSHLPSYKKPLQELFRVASKYLIVKFLTNDKKTKTTSNVQWDESFLRTEINKNEFDEAIKNMNPRHFFRIDTFDVTQREQTSLLKKKRLASKRTPNNVTPNDYSIWVIRKR